MMNHFPKIYTVVATGGDYEEFWLYTVCWFNYRRDAEDKVAQLQADNKVFTNTHRDWQLRMYAYQNGYEEANPRPPHAPKPTLVSQEEWSKDPRCIEESKWWDKKMADWEEWLASNPEPESEWEAGTHFYVEELRHG